jgi:two-component system NtrC family response regulator
MQDSDSIQILVVDDEKSIRRLAQKELASSQREIRTAASAREALAEIQRQPFDVIVLDMRLPDGNGLDLMMQLRESIPEVEVILITGFGDIDNAVEAMKLGAYDYITKPFNLDRLELVIEKAYQRVRLQRENRLLRHTQDQRPPNKLIGHSEHMEHIHFLIGRVAPTQTPVLITGESGTGKNVVAQALHARSRRCDNPLITKNCGTLQKDLMRSELFGHRKGAFTGAEESREGLLAMAHKGTLFLDEIGELSLEVQASLLRVLENQTYRRVGDKEERTVDVRFIFATNRDLAGEKEAGRFSEALYHRLNVFNIKVAPLRERLEDIPALAEFFLGRLCPGNGTCRLTKRAMQLLLAYAWPGNVRELQNVIERGIILSETGVITERELPGDLLASSREAAHDHPFAPLAELEKEHILRVLRFVGGSRSKAAEILGIGRKTLYRKLKSIEDS